MSAVIGILIAIGILIECRYHGMMQAKNQKVNMRL